MFGERLLALWLQLLSSKRSLLKDQTGASAIEYALIVGLIVGVLVTVFTAFGDQISGLFESVGEEITGATENGGG